MQVIYTRKQEPVLVDDEDYTFLLQYTWRLNTVGYVQAWVSGKTVSMHLLLADRHSILQNNYIDHEDRNKSNNQKHNLRAATQSQNSANRPMNSNNRCGYKGVWWNVLRQTFQAQLMCHRRKIHLGYFDSAIKAAEAYDYAARKFFGKFACCNFQEKSDAIAPL